MNLEEFFRESTIKDAILHVSNLPPGCCYVKRGVELTPSSPLTVPVFDWRDLSTDEQTALDSLLHRRGLVEFLSRDLIEDVLGNLSEQDRHCTAAEVFEALISYWKRDAFMDLGERRRDSSTWLTHNCRYEWPR